MDLASINRKLRPQWPEKEMTEGDPIATLSEFREYFASATRLADRIGINHLTLADVLTNSRRPMARTIIRLRAFLDAEGKQSAGASSPKGLDALLKQGALERSRCLKWPTAGRQYRHRLRCREKSGIT
jgi:hypothetical protein